MIQELIVNAVGCKTCCKFCGRKCERAVLGHEGLKHSCDKMGH